MADWKDLPEGLSIEPKSQGSEGMRHLPIGLKIFQVQETANAKP